MQSINAAALLIGAAGLLSRALGVVRDRLLASSFGASRELDIYYAAFQVPDFLYTVFLLAAASAAIIPVLLEVRAEGEERARQFLERIILLVSAGSAVVSLAAFFAMPALAAIVAPGFSADERTLLVAVSRIMLVSPILLGISNVLSSVVQAARFFGVYALSGIVYNAGIIFGIVFLAPVFGLPGLAWGVAIGALLHFLIHVRPFYRLGFRLPLLRSARAVVRDGILDRATALVLKRSFPRILALSFRQITFIALVAIASKLLAGSVAILQFAYNLQYIPVGIFGLSFAVAAFPQLAEAGMRHDAAFWVRTLTGAVRAVFFWVAPATALFYVLRAQIVRVALGGGLFDWSDTILTAAVFGVFSVAILAESLIPLFSRSLYSVGETKKPFFIAAVSSVFSIGAAIGLVTFLQHGPSALLEFFRHFFKVGSEEGIAVIGLSLAFALGGVFQALMLFFVIRREAPKRFGGGVSIPLAWSEIFRIIWVSLFAGLVAFGTLRTVNLAVTLETFLGVLAQGAAAFSAGAIAYVGTLYLLGNREVTEVFAVARRRLLRKDVLPQELDGDRAEDTH